MPSLQKVSNEPKKNKKNQIQKVKLKALKQLNPEQFKINIHLPKLPSKMDRLEFELDEMWSYVSKIDNARWLWQDKRPY